MKKTSRRNLLKTAAAGSVAATGIGAMLNSERGSVALSAQDRGSGREDVADAHRHDAPAGALSGRRAAVAVSFGQWEATPANPLDRFPTNSPNNRNVHKVLPFEAEIEAGGAVSFIISGVHQILIYDDGTKLSDVREILSAANPILVDDPRNRIYRGLDPTLLSYVRTPLPTDTTLTPIGVRDRVEAVNFPEPGRYLVVCGVVFHFREGMHGFVNVRR